MEHGGTLVVSVGLGCSTLPIRLNSEPEIILCRIAAARGASSHEASGHTS
jgi:predicted MPP superfamily phosphohydrolase